MYTLNSALTSFEVIIRATNPLKLLYGRKSAEKSDPRFGLEHS